jgi:hypothetical protein
MGAVFALLIKGQDGFRREPEISQLNQSARVGLDMINRDLTMAGYKTPGASAIIWSDGGGFNPDEITMIYADPEVATSEPIKCGGAGAGGGGGPCQTINNSSTLNIEIATLDPYPVNPAQAYGQTMLLSAIETADCNGDGQIGIYPFEVTQPPLVTSASGQPVLQLNHNPGLNTSGINLPGGFNREVHPDCALIGLFRVIQYRVSPLPPTPAPLLERRDLSSGDPWIPVSQNIENLQLQYATPLADMMDVPAMPRQDNPLTWINRVRVTVSSRSESKDLQGATPGVFSAEDRYLRKSFSTVVSPRNLSYQAGMVTSAQSYN